MHKASSSERNTQGKNASHSSEESLRACEAVLDASGLAVLFASNDGLIARFNAAASHLLGYALEEINGKSCLLLVDQEILLERMPHLSGAADDQGELFRKLAATGQGATANVPCTFIRKGGSRFAGAIRFVPLTDVTGETTGFAGILTPLTDMEKLREQLEVSEQKFRLLAENITGAIFLCRNDEVYSVIYINDHIHNITGYDKSEFLSGAVNLGGLLHPDDREYIAKTINECVKARRSYHIQYRLQHASGEWRWVDETGVGVYEGGHPTMLEGFIYDITSQKATEEKLQKIAEQNLRFFNNPVNLNAVSDFQGFLQRISPSWTRMLGWSEEELKSRPVFDFVHPDDIASTREALRFISRSGSVHTFENRFACKDGSYRWLLWGSATDPEAKMIYASAVDISARKQSEENILDSKSTLEGITHQLQEQNRRLDEFAHIISHNMRAPVNNIQALINLLNKDSGIEDFKLIFEKLKNVSKNLSESMTELMDSLKARTQPQVDLSEVRFKEVLDKVVQSLEGELIVAKASVTFDFNDAPAILYSKQYLESIFQNLLTNAIKYRSPKRNPKIHFRTSHTDNHVELSVSDNGQGIDMDRFGDKLFGLHKTFHDHEEARGVGLFLIKSQIEAMGGTISASSEVDKGTTFTIRFN